MEAFALGRSGVPRVVMLRGEPGIGKTRLVQEFLSAVASDGAPGPRVVVASGQCVDVGAIGSPFLAVRRLLRNLHREAGGEAFVAAAGTPGAVTVLGALVPGLTDGGDDISADRSPDVVAEVVERLIVNLSAGNHLVLVTEDLHWADASTFDLLRTLAITERGAHVTIVGTYRPEDMQPDHPFRLLLAELERNRSVTTIELARLSADDTTRLARELAPELAEDAAETIAARSQGVPFFIEELVEVPEGRLPETLREIVMARVLRLSSGGRAVVGKLSVGGVHVDHEIFDAIDDSGASRDGLREAIEASVIATDERGFTFRHALIQEVVNESLLPGERAALHREYAEALQARVDAGDIGSATEAAEHWLAARDLPRAFDATVTAREHAKRTLAISAAIQLGRRLIELWPLVPDAEERAGRRASHLAIEVMRACNASGDLAALLEVGRSTLAMLGDEDPVGRAGIHRMLSVGLFNDYRLDESNRELATAESLVENQEGREADAAKALLMAMRLVRNRELSRAEFEQATAVCLELAERSCTPVELSSVCTLAAWGLAEAGDLEKALVVIERADPTAYARRLDPNAETVHTWILMSLGMFAEAAAAFQESLTLIEERALGYERIDGTFRFGLAEALIALGRADEARTLMEESATRTPADVEFRQEWLGNVGRRLELWDDDPHGLEPAVTPGETIDLDDALRRCVLAAEQDLARREDARDELLRRSSAVAAAEALQPVTGPDYARFPGVLRDAIPVMARTLDALADSPDPPGATHPLSVILTTALAHLGDDAAARALRAFARAELGRATEPVEEVVAAHRRAVEAAAEGFLAVRHRHCIELRFAEALCAAGEKDEAALLLAQLIATAPAHGASRVARWARRAAERARLRLVSPSEPEAAPTGSSLDRLTDREREVLALVAKGLSNPDIGRRLFISPKTASVHVSAILTKLGAANRTEAAALFSAQDAPR